LAELDDVPSGSAAASDAAGAQLISEIDEEDDEDQIEIRMLHTAAAASFGAPASQAPSLDAGSTLTQALGATAPGRACLELLRARREHCAAASEVVRLGSALTPLKEECQSIRQEHTRADARASAMAATLNACRKRIREIDEAHHAAEIDRDRREIDEAHHAAEAGPSELEAARGFVRVAHHGAVASDGQVVQSPATLGNGEPRSRRRLDPD
jgi:chromosome segregation ATPase